MPRRERNKGIGNRQRLRNIYERDIVSIFWHCFFFGLCFMRLGGSLSQKENRRDS